MLMIPVVWGLFEHTKWEWPKGCDVQSLESQMIETELINLAQLTKIQFSTSSQDLKLDIGPVQF